MDIGAGLSREERETHVWFNEQDDTLEISTASPLFARKLEKVCLAYGVQIEQRGPWDVRASLPVSCLKLNKPVHLSDVERERRSISMRERRAAQLAGVA